MTTMLKKSGSFALSARSLDSASNFGFVNLCDSLPFISDFRGKVKSDLGSF